MAYTTVPTITTGDVATAAWGNTYIKDNFAQTFPGLVTTDGDIVVATGSAAGKRLAATGSGDTFIHEIGGLEANVSAGDGYVEIKSGSTTVRKSNLAASAAPTVNEDTGDGYSVGSIWLDTTNDQSYIMADASSGAAVWKQTTASGNVIRDGGQATEATTTSTSAVDLLTTASLSIARGSVLKVFAVIRKTTGASDSAQAGFKYNTTEMLAPVDWGSTGNEVDSGYWRVQGIYSQASYLLGATSMKCTSGANGSRIDRPSTVNMPAAVMTSMIMRATAGSSSITMGADEMHVYTFSVT